MLMLSNNGVDNTGVFAWVLSFIRCLNHATAVRNSSGITAYYNPTWVQCRACPGHLVKKPMKRTLFVALVLLGFSSIVNGDYIVEVDRYIVWPGKALAYKTGELKIKELRAYATDELGEAFDIREFHDEVLGRGAVPLSVLDANIKNWVRTKKTK